MYSYSSSSVLLRMLCLLSITRFVAGYRPYYRPHDTSMDLAKSHRSPRFYFITNEGDLPTVPSPAAPLAVARGPVEEPASSPANTSGSPISSPRQIPPEETASSPPNSSAPALPISLPRQIPSFSANTSVPAFPISPPRQTLPRSLEDSPVSHGVSTPPQVRNIPLRFQRDTAAATRSMSSITTRQIHNADYGASSSNAPSSSSNSSSNEHASAPAKEDQDQASPPTSTKEEQDQKQASSSSAADSTHGTDKREQTEMSDVWNGRRLPRAVATRRMLTSDDISNQSEKSINDDSSSNTHTDKDSSTNSYSSSKDGSNGKDSGSGETDDGLVRDDEDADSNPDAAPKRVERTIAFRFRR